MNGTSVSQINTRAVNTAFWTQGGMILFERCHESRTSATALTQPPVVCCDELELWPPTREVLNPLVRLHVPPPPPSTDTRTLTHNAHPSNNARDDCGAEQ